MRFQAERAHATYDEALALLPEADRDAQKPGLMMANIYRTCCARSSATASRCCTSAPR
jgi:phytoene/squalene synthetase